MSRISVVIPLYNQGQRITHTIDSVLAQTLAPCEIIVVDDGSTDDPAQHLVGYPEVTLITQSNKGPSAARNTGIRLATGDWIALLDADDTWSPNHLARLVVLSQDYPNAQVLCSGYQFDYGTHVIPAKLKQQVSGILDDYFLACCHADLPITSSSVMVQRRALIEQGCFDVNLRTGEDQTLWSKLAVHYVIALSIKPTMTYWIGERQHAVDSESGSDKTVNLHHLVLTPAPQLQTYKVLLADEQYQQWHHSIAQLAHLTVLSCVKQNLILGDTRVAKTLLSSHWAIQHDRWYWIARCLCLVPNRIIKWGLGHA